MSRFIDKLNKVAKTEPQPMGFMSAKAAPPKSRMLLIASMVPDDIDGLAGYASGADALLLNFTKSSPNAKIFKKLSQTFPDTPWGGWLTDVSVKALTILVKADADFVVFPLESDVSAFGEENKLGRTLQVDLSLGADLLRTINELSVDAMLATQGTEQLTWRQVLLFQRLAGLVDKPLIVSVPPHLSTGELKTLWEAGVDAVVIEVGSRQPEGKLKELRQALDDAAFLPPRKHGKAEVLLPHISSEPEPAVEEEEEEE